MLLEILGIVHLTGLRNHSVAHSHRESDSVGPSGVRAFDKRPEKNEKNSGFTISGEQGRRNIPVVGRKQPILLFNPWEIARSSM